MARARATVLKSRLPQVMVRARARVLKVAAAVLVPGASEEAAVVVVLASSEVAVECVKLDEVPALQTAAVRVSRGALGLQAVKEPAS